MSSELTGNKRKIKLWKTCLTTIVDDRNKMVQVFFKHAPPSYGFVDYVVSLNNALTKRGILRIKTNTTSATFTNLKKGKYVIIVFPKDHNYMCGSYCARQKTDIFSIGENTNDLLNLTVCGNNRTQTLINQPFEIIDSPNVNIWKYFFFLPLLFLIMAFVIYKYKRRPMTANDSSIDSLTTNKTTSSGKVKVFVVYAEDHTLHTEACRLFIHYLNEHCFCDVLNTFPEYSSVPAYDMEKYSDFVLVVISQAFHREFYAWKYNEIHTTVASQAMFEKVLLNVKQSPPAPGSCQYLMCAMDYTDDCYLPSEFGGCKLFKIIDDMTYLVCHLQNLDLRVVDDIDVPRIEEHIYSSYDGVTLISAIKDADKFEKTHTDWFQEKNTLESYLKEDFPFINGTP